MNDPELLARDWIELIYRARHAFVVRYYWQPTEIHLPDRLRRDILTDRGFATMFTAGTEVTIFGMRIVRTIGPLALIARRGDRVFRWAFGFDEVVIHDERFAYWKSPTPD